MPWSKLIKRLMINIKTKKDLTSLSSIEFPCDCIYKLIKMEYEIMLLCNTLGIGIIVMIVLYHLIGTKADKKTYWVTFYTKSYFMAKFYFAMPLRKYVFCSQLTRTSYLKLWFVCFVQQFVHWFVKWEHWGIITQLFFPSPQKCSIFYGFR